MTKKYLSCTNPKEKEQFFMSRRRRSTRSSGELIDFEVETQKDPRDDDTFGRYSHVPEENGDGRKLYKTSTLINNDGDDNASSKEFLDASAPLVGDTFFEIGDINERFMSGDNSVVQEMRPPYAPRISERDQQQMFDWQRRRQQRITEVRSSPGYKFAMLVASETNTQLQDLYDDSDTGELPLEIGPSYVGAEQQPEPSMLQSGVRVRFQEGDGDNVVMVSDDDADATTTEGDAGGLEALERRADLQAKIESVQDPEVRRELQESFNSRVQRERLLTRRVAMRNERRYIERPQNIGIMYFTPMLSGQLDQAIVMLPRFAPQLAPASPEAYIKDDRARASLAILVGALINLKRFEAPTRWFPKELYDISRANVERIRKLFRDRYTYNADEDRVYEVGYESTSRKRKYTPLGAQQERYPRIEWL